MKSVREIARTANVSRTSIYNLIKKHNIPTFKHDGKTVLDENSENLVIGYYSTEQHESISDIITNTREEVETQNCEADLQSEIQNNNMLEYTRVIGILEDERDEKNKVIKELLQSNKILCQALATDKMNETARLIMKDGTYRVGEKVRESGIPKSFFKRIFRRKLAKE